MRRRITAALGAVALTTGVLFGTAAPATAQAEGSPTGRCVGSSLLMFATSALCVVDRNFPVLTGPAG
ncbi:hypothetical protein Q5425_33370 [Amycolatopsis sp. A133]|uniref:hypothetical protein n=1 Tax=Amycolatopsis sp. A133 TaxID=3064472 RepID=UPI0027FE9C6C|nr:hypothetical protein [Amycolatopsis sp. A133]MDQ7808650.1 hypothetical protein [Amycolatopsis sp. A133]